MSDDMTSYTFPFPQDSQLSFFFPLRKDTGVGNVNCHDFLFFSIVPFISLPVQQLYINIYYSLNDRACHGAGPEN